VACIPIATDLLFVSIGRGRKGGEEEEGKKGKWMTLAADLHCHFLHIVYPVSSFYGNAIFGRGGEKKRRERGGKMLHSGVTPLSQKKGEKEKKGMGGGGRCLI